MAGIPHNPDFNGARQEGCGLYQVTQRGARRCSAAAGCLKPALSRSNLTLRTDCRATRIIIEKGRAVGVEYRQGAGGSPTVARAAQEVIVAAGAIGSPRLLLLSGIGPAGELPVEVVHDLPGVGKNLQDHIDVYTINALSGRHSYDHYRKYVRREHLPGPQARTRDDIAAHARRFGKTDYHPVGTCKMGVGEMAVVAPSLRVRGLAGLRVADSSIMPRLVSSNTNAASIMIGERASDLVKGNRALAPE